MADFSIPVTIPDGKVNDFVSALRLYYGRKGDGTEFTVAELKARVKDETERRFKSIYKEWKAAQSNTDDLGIS